MIRKNRQGRVVEFEDESIWPSRYPVAMTASRQARESAVSPGDAGGHRESVNPPASEEEIEFRHDAAVMRAREDSSAAAGTEMARLEARVANLDAGAKRAREAARQKFKSAEREAERIRRLAVEQAESELDVILDCIRVDFHAALEPINAEVAEMRAQQKKSLEETLSSLRELREKQLAVLAESRKPAAPEEQERKTMSHPPLPSQGQLPAQGEDHEVQGR